MIVTFLCGRCAHSRRFFNSLSKVREVQGVNLIVVKDSCFDTMSNEEILTFSKSFLSLEIIEQDFNFGLRQNILFGLDLAVARFETVIVLENDLEVSTDMMSYVAAYLHLRNFTGGLRAGCLYSFNNEQYFGKRPSSAGFSKYFLSWGWVITRQDWNEFRLVIDQTCLFRRLLNLRRYNANYSYNYWVQLFINGIHLKRTWAIYFYDFIFRNNYVVLVPEYSLSRNIGWDSSGDNCGENSAYVIESLPDFNMGTNVGYIDFNFEEWHRKNVPYNFIKDLLYSVVSKARKMYRGK